MTKILYSPGFGAGWSTWAYGINDEQRKFMLTYQPLIDAIENKQEIGYTDNFHEMQNVIPGSVLDKFRQEWIARWGGDNSPFMGGARDLAVTTVDGPFRIDEYDGNETVIEISEQRWTTL